MANIIITVCITDINSEFPQHTSPMEVMREGNSKVIVFARTWKTQNLPEYQDLYSRDIDGYGPPEGEDFGSKLARRYIEKYLFQL